MSAFDPAKFGVDLETYPPDKEAGWTYPAEKDGWYHAHDSIRMELDAFAEALATVVARNGAGAAPEAWEIRAMQKWWKSHSAHVHSHHSNEDDLFNPYLRTRFNYPEKLESDHVTLIAQMEKLEALISDELATGAAGTVATLVSEWTAYVGMMKPHLLEEEEQGIPCMRAYFTHEEIGALVGKILSNPAAPKEEMGAFICCMGPDVFREEFMPQEGIPFFVWYLDFKGKYEHYITEVKSQIDGLMSGEPPAVKKAMCC
jgi:hemerythrin-like domain-containing protein